MKLSKNQWIGIVVAVIVVSLFFFQFFGDVFFSEYLRPENNQVLDVMTKETAEEKADGVIIRNIVVGTGEEALPGATVAVHYTGKLSDGTVFDSSVSRGVPFQFVLGIGQVIRGWDQGVAGMRVGGKRELIISPEAAYGAQGVQNQQTGEYVIPQNATLTFEVELLGVSTPQATTQ